MNRRRRPLSCVVAMMLGCVLALVAFAAPAGAADDGIPRPPGAIDARGYELVSMADKNQSQVQALGNLSADGNSAWYTAISGVPGAQSGMYVQLRAKRTAAGWQSKSMLPPRDQMAADGYFVMATKPDLTGWIATAQDSLGLGSMSPDGTLLRLDDDGGQQLLHFFPVYTTFHSGVDSVASDDLSHVYAQVRDTLDGSHQVDTWNVYDFGSGSPVLVSRMEGTGLAPACGVEDFAINAAATVGEHRISTDGRYAFFTTRGDNCGDPNELYVRNNQGTPSTADDRTTLISGPPLVGDTANGVNAFLQATPDGSQVFYRTATSLDPVDDVDLTRTDQDVYRWTMATGTNTCITCSGVSGVTTRLVFGLRRSAIAEDGSHVYFLSSGRLGDAPAAATGGAPNLYVWRNGTIHFVVRTDLTGLTADPIYAGDLTPDGTVLIFQSARSVDLDRRSGSAGNSTVQFYRYDDGDDSVTCLSCPATGATTSAPNLLAVNNQSITDNVRAMSDDGDIVFFPSYDKLVSQDVNGDIDLYEWHDGQVGLITNGRTAYGQATPAFLDASADGRDVLFEDIASLTAEATDRVYKVYDARAGGGFTPPAAQPSCDGDQCHGLPSDPPGLEDPGSAVLTGDGNLPLETAAPPVGRFVVAKVRDAQRARLAATGRLRLVVRVNRGGMLSAQAKARIGKRVRTVSRTSATAAAAGRVALTLRLSRAARTKLATAGRLRVVVGLQFSEAPTAKRLVLSLKATANGR